MSDVICRFEKRTKLEHFGSAKPHTTHSPLKHPNFQALKSILSKECLNRIMLLIVFAVILSFAESKGFPLYYRNVGDASTGGIECDSEATIGELREVLIKAISPGKEAKEFKISMSFGGRQLNEDDKTLPDAAICSEAVIEVSVEKILADGCYKFVSAQFRTVLEASLVRDPQIYAYPHSIYNQEDDVFCIERQPCESYTVRCQNEAFWYLTDDRIPKLFRSDATEGIQLFDFVYDDNDKWFIKRKNNDDKAMTVIAGLYYARAGGVQEMSLFDVHHQVRRLSSKDQQLFYCERQGRLTKWKRASEISSDILQVLICEWWFWYIVVVFVLISVVEIRVRGE